MNDFKLGSKIKSMGENVIIEFNDNITKYDCIFDPQMRGRVVSVKTNNEIIDGEEFNSIELCVDMSDFVEYNKQFMIADYYDLNGVPNKTYLEADPNTEHIDTVFFTAEDSTFKIVDNNDNKVFLDYLASQSNLSYVKWLEKKYIENLD